MMFTGLEVTGTAQTIAALRNTGPMIQNKARQVVKRAMPRAVATMQAEVPVLTGRLRRSIKGTLHDDGMWYAVGPDPDVFDAEGVGFYPLFVALGTVNMEANDFQGRTAAIEGPAFAADLEDVLRRAINAQNFRSG
jgi:HK97 gp10 family phage protein